MEFVKSNSTLIEAVDRSSALAGDVRAELATRVPNLSSQEIDMLTTLRIMGDAFAEAATVIMAENIILEALLGEQGEQ